MTLARPMTSTERAALADAIRHMRGVGIRPRDIIASGAAPHFVNRPIDVLRVRRNGKRAGQ